MEDSRREITMITQEQIPTVLDHPVYDTDGNKIGDAKHVFLDDATRRPEWVSVKTGLFGTSESFVPLSDASLVEDHLEVPYRKDKVKDAPNVDVDAAWAPVRGGRTPPVRVLRHRLGRRLAAGRPHRHRPRGRYHG